MKAKDGKNHSVGYSTTETHSFTNLQRIPNPKKFSLALWTNYIYIAICDRIRDKVVHFSQSLSGIRHAFDFILELQRR